MNASKLLNEFIKDNPDYQFIRIDDTAVFSVKTGNYITVWIDSESCKFGAVSNKKTGGNENLIQNASPESIKKFLNKLNK